MAENIKKESTVQPVHEITGFDVLRCTNPCKHNYCNPSDLDKVKNTSDPAPLIKTYDSSSPSIKCSTTTTPVFKFKLDPNNKNAMLPTKKFPSDTGYDVLLTHLIPYNSTGTCDKTVTGSGAVHRFGTGLFVECPPGYALDIVVKSRLSTSGFMLANSVGIIDNSYRGEIMVALYQLHPSAGYDLPWLAVQLIPRKLIDAEFVLADNLGDTERGNTGGIVNDLRQK